MSFFLPIFKWSDGTWIGATLRQSVWLFPIVETFHLLALAFLLGTITILSLRLFGLIMARQSVADVARNLAPWTLGCLVIALISGWCLFSSEAFKCYDSTPFRIKMVCLFLAILYHFTVYRKVTRLDQSQLNPLLGRIAGALSLLLWFSVGLAGRAIGFL
jgi:uncharacterized membrane protein